MTEATPPARPPRTEVASVHPAPEPAVLTAIVAAVEEAWPRPKAVANAGAGVSTWRFSGRWWSKPSTLRRDRPG